MKAPAIWNEVDFRLSVVNRWQVMPTIRKQNVAEHQHNVAKLAERLAIEVFGWDPDADPLAELLHRALEHDDLEAIIGDPPSYTKKYIDEAAMTEQFSALLREPLYDDICRPDISFIVMAADYIDAAIFLRVEISMGNRTVAGVLRNLEHRFRMKCEAYIVDFAESPRSVNDAMAAWRAYLHIVDTMFAGNGQLTIEGFRF